MQCMLYLQLHTMSATGTVGMLDLKQLHLCSVQLQVVTQTTRERGHLEGTLILLRTGDRRLEPGAGALVLGVGGDTLLGLGQLLESQMYTRPMALDLLWQVSSTWSNLQFTRSTPAHLMTERLTRLHSSLPVICSSGR